MVHVVPSSKPRLTREFQFSLVRKLSCTAEPTYLNTSNFRADDEVLLVFLSSDLSVRVVNLQLCRQPWGDKSSRHRDPRTPERNKNVMKKQVISMHVYSTVQ